MPSFAGGVAMLFWWGSAFPATAPCFSVQIGESSSRGVAWASASIFLLPVNEQPVEQLE
jgi:hypothetical protein